MRTWGVQSTCFRIGFAALALIVLASGAGALSNSGGGSWWYYRDITISNTGSDLTDYQVLVSLNSDNFPLNLQTNGADIRFTDAGGAELSYWIEKWDYAGRNAKIWVNVTSIPASGSASIRMYYGNPSATSASNGMNVFPFFDDFNGLNLSSKWINSVSQEGRGIVTVSSGVLNLIANPTPGPSGTWSVGEFAQVKSTVNFSLPYKLFYRYYTNVPYNYTYIDTGLPGKALCYNMGGMSDYGATAIQYFSESGGVSNGILKLMTGMIENLRVLSINSTFTKTDLAYSPPNVFKTMKYFANSSSVRFVLDDIVVASHSTNIPTTPLPIMFEASQAPSGLSRCGYYDITIPSEYHVDYVFLANYSYPEPSVNVGAELLIDPTGDWFIGSNGNPATGYSYADIIAAEIIQLNSTHLQLKITVNGTIPSFGWQGYLWHLDTDKNINTGGSNPNLFNDIGWDYTIEIAGISGPPYFLHQIRSYGVPQTVDGQMNGIPVPYEVNGNTISTVISLADIGNPSSFYWITGTTDGIQVNDKAPNTGHAIFSVSGVTQNELLSNSIGYSALVATGQNTYVQASNGSFGVLVKGQTKTINNSVILNNTGDIPAKIEARFNDSVAGVFGLISGANVLNATNFDLGIPSTLVPLSSLGADVQVAVAPPGVTALDARLTVPSDQLSGDYSGTVILTFSNSV